jgi:hypothetical protein
VRLTALLPLLAAVPLFALPAPAAGASGCFDPAAPLTVEEQRLTASLPAGGPAVGPELVRLAGFDPLVAEVKHDLCAARTPRRAERVVTQAGDRLWRTAVDRAQGRRPDLGTLDRFDDRPLYWARLQLSSAIRQWAPASASQRATLLTVFDRGSRGLDDVRFPLGKTRRVMVSGFDPFQLDGPGITISNPAGASALQLDGRVLDTPVGPSVVQAVSFPVVWGYFDQGIVEAAYGTALRDRTRRPDVVLTISQGRPGRFDVERWAGAWRGGFPDGRGLAAAGRPVHRDDAAVLADARGDRCLSGQLQPGVLRVAGLRPPGYGDAGVPVGCPGAGRDRGFGRRWELPVQRIDVPSQPRPARVGLDGGGGRSPAHAGAGPAGRAHRPGVRSPPPSDRVRGSGPDFRRGRRFDLAGSPANSGIAASGAELPAGHGPPRLSSHQADQLQGRFAEARPDSRDGGQVKYSGCRGHDHSDAG